MVEAVASVGPEWRATGREEKRLDHDRNDGSVLCESARSLARHFNEDDVREDEAMDVFGQGRRRTDKTCGERRQSM